MWLYTKIWGEMLQTLRGQMSQTRRESLRNQRNLTNLWASPKTVSPTNLQEFSTQLQGLLLAMNFDQPEGERAFRLGSEIDPEAAMFHWGIQQVRGPGANR